METILIVDDNEDLRWNLSNILKDEGYETIGAGDGKRGIKEVKKNSPDLVLLDMKLPGIDGLTVLEEMMNMKLHGASRWYLRESHGLVPWSVRLVG